MAENPLDKKNLIEATPESILKGGKKKDYNFVPAGLYNKLVRYVKALKDIPDAPVELTYNEYRANFNQAGTAAPVPVAASECGTITGVTHGRNGVGEYTITKVGAFGNKTSVILSGYTNAYVSTITNDVITYFLYNAETNVPVDGHDNIGIIITVKK